MVCFTKLPEFASQNRSKLDRTPSSSFDREQNLATNFSFEHVASTSSVHMGSFILFKYSCVVQAIEGSNRLRFGYVTKTWWL